MGWLRLTGNRILPSRDSEAELASQKKSGGTMKIRIRVLMFALVVAASSAVTARALVCNNATIRGTYAYTIHGQVFIPNGPTLLIDGLARTTFDGEGNLTELDAVAANGNLTPGWVLNTGTYSVNPDCTGTITVTNGNQPEIHLQILVAQSGNKIHEMVIDPGFATTSDGERIKAPQQ
jgi:hypothetical protein